MPAFSTLMHLPKQLAEHVYYLANVPSLAKELHHPESECFAILHTFL
jgi:hypothetical protein